MRRRPPILLVAAWAALALVWALGPAQAGEPVFPKASRIGLSPPPGLVVSTHSIGFEDTARRVSIDIFDLPGPAYEAIERSAFGKDPNNALTVDKRELFAFADGVGFLITGHLQLDGAEVRTYDLLINTFNAKVGQAAAFVRVHVPEAAEAAYPKAAIRTALHSVTFRVPPVADLLDRLPFKFGDMAGFRPMRVLPPAVAVLIDGPKDDPLKYPYMIVSLGRGAPEQQDARARFARDLLMTAPLKDIAVTSVESMRIQNLPGYEIRANAVAPDGTPVTVVQWLRFGSSGFLRVIGVVARDKWDALFPRFRALRDGIDLH